MASSTVPDWYAVARLPQDINRGANAVFLSGRLSELGFGFVESDDI